MTQTHFTDSDIIAAIFYQTSRQDPVAGSSGFDVVYCFTKHAATSFNTSLHSLRKRGLTASDAQKLNTLVRHFFQSHIAKENLFMAKALPYDVRLGVYQHDFSIELQYTRDNIARLFRAYFREALDKDPSFFGSPQGNGQRYISLSPPQKVGVWALPHNERIKVDASLKKHP